MREETLDYSKSYNSKEFFEVHEMQRYCNVKIDGRHVTFNVTEPGDYHMYFVSGGNGYLQIKDEHSQYQLSRLDILIYQPKGNQELISPRMTNYVHCIFSGTSVKQILDRLDLLCNVVYHIPPSYDSGESYMYFNRQIEYVISEKRKKKNYYELSTACMFIEFLTVCSRNINNEKDKQNIQYIKKAAAYILEHAHEDIDIEKLLEISHLSKSRFYSLFKQYTGTSPVNFRNRYLLAAAVDYLVIYNMKIQEISKILGFKDPLYFSRLFKKEFGVSPSEYAHIHKDDHVPAKKNEEE